jgi:hypothetical protein
VSDKSNEADPEDTGIVASPPSEKVPVTLSTAAGEESRRVGASGDGAPTAGDVVALAAESAVAVSVQAVRLGFRATSTVVAAADRLGAGRLWRLATRVLAGALEGPAQGGRDDIETVRRIAERQLTRVLAVVVPVVVDNVDVESVVERIDVSELIARTDVNELLEHVDIDRFLDRVDVDALMDRVDIWKLVDRAKLGEVLAEHTDRMADWNADFAERQAAGLETVVNRAVDRVRGAYHGGLAAGSHSAKKSDDLEST